MRVLALSLCLAMSACAPMLELRGDALNEPNPVIAFCAALASGDPVAVAGLFEPSVSDAIKAAASADALPPFASRKDARNCRPGRVWYWGGSRNIYEVQYDGFADRLDMWRSSEGKFTELHYGDGGQTLKERLGLVSGVVRPF